MKKNYKIKTILLTILVFSCVEFTFYIAYALWNIKNGISDDRSLTEEET